MEILVNRYWPNPLATIGTLAVNGGVGWFTLELPWKDNAPDVSCIPPGTYDVQLLPSQKFHRIMPHVMDVPGRAGVLIHWGNYPADTDGCILVGMTRASDTMIGESVEAFNDIFPQMQKAVDAGEKITLTVAQPQPTTAA